jgi:hypothetical protein
MVSRRSILQYMSIKTDSHRVATFWSTEQVGHNTTNDKTPCARSCKAPLQCWSKKQMIVHRSSDWDRSRRSCLYPRHLVVARFPGVVVVICGRETNCCENLTGIRQLILAHEALLDNEYPTTFTKEVHILFPLDQSNNSS